MSQKPDDAAEIPSTTLSAPSLASLGEFGLIGHLSRLLPSLASNVEVGIGDDAAVIRLGDHTLLATTDALLENVHFRRDWSTARDLGWKALAVSLSDIAAMGGVPSFALISLGLPAGVELEWIEAFYAGMAELSALSGCAVIGGDTVHSPDGIYLTLSVIGEAPEGRYITRSGAKPGDVLLVTGALGDSLAGYYALERSREIQSLADAVISEQGFPSLPSGTQYCLRAHFRPQPRLEAGLAALQSGLVHAMMDLSDGLSGDVRHIAERSGVGIRIDPHHLPLSDALKETAGYLGMDAAELSLAGGEDYELLMAVPPEAVDAVQAAVEATGTLLTVIGECTDLPGEIVMTCDDGREEPLSHRSWDHFKE